MIDPLNPERTAAKLDTGKDIFQFEQGAIVEYKTPGF